MTLDHKQVKLAHPAKYPISRRQLWSRRFRLDWRRGIHGAGRSLRGTSRYPGPDDFFLRLSERTLRRLRRGHLVALDEYPQLGLVWSKGNRHFWVLGNPLKVEDISETAIGFCQVGPVTSGAFGREDATSFTPDILLRRTGLRRRDPRSKSCQHGESYG